MLIGVISDTHDRLPMIDAALDLFARRRVEAVIHPGDFVSPFAVRRLLKYKGPLYATYGNNDGERAGLKALLPNVADGPLTVKLAGKTIVMHHFIDWLKPADIAPADAIITGHTHEVVNQVKNGKLYLNPGECCGWVQDKCTAAVLDLATMKAEIVEVHE